MAIVIIGGKEHHVPELNFVALERAWPKINEALINMDPVTVVGCAMSVIAAGLMEAEDFDIENYGIKAEQLSGQGSVDDQIYQALTYRIKKQTKSAEVEGIRKAFHGVLMEAGLEVDMGELMKQLLDSPQVLPGLNRSMATAPLTSPSLSPQDTREEAGTE